MYVQMIWQNHKQNKLVYSFKGSGRSWEYLLVELEGTACYVGQLLNHVEGFGLLSSFFFFGFKTHFQLTYTCQSQAFSVHILSYFTLLNHKGSRWPVLFQFPCRHNIPTELVVGVGAPHSCVYYRVILHQRTFPPSRHFLAFLVG